MTRWEQLSFVALVESIKPKVSIEIGNAQGGSLQILSAKSGKVYALDFNPETHEKLKGRYANVEFITGDSKKILPDLLKKIEANNEMLEFVLIDGDHSTSGVKGDINCFLHHFTPRTECVILFHDSFNPVCRKGILLADWQNCPYVHGVDTDYLPGFIMEKGTITHEKNTLWGGFAIAYMKPEIRKETLEVRESLKPMYNAMFRRSKYNGPVYRIGSLLRNRFR